MRALVCRELGPADSLVIEERPRPMPGHGEVVVKVHAAALNFPDTLAIQGRYQMRAPLPFVPGGEAAGIVEEAGAGVSAFAAGDRVIYTGATGAFAEVICVPERMLLRAPAQMDFRTAASFSVAYATSYHALKQRAALKSGETMLVLGAAGGVGLAAVDLGVAMGARVIAAASAADKLELARSVGAQDGINYRTESLRDRVKALTGDTGVDVVYDPVGGELSEQALRAIAWNGRYLVVGFAAGEIPKIPLNLPLLKGCSINGVFLGAWREREPAEYLRNFDELFAMHAAGRLHPMVSEAFPLERYREAFAVLTERRARGKVLFEMNDSR